MQLADVATLLALIDPTPTAWVEARMSIERGAARGSTSKGRLQNNLAFVTVALGGDRLEARESYVRAAGAARGVGEGGRVVAAINAIETLETDAERRANVAELAKQLEKLGDEQVLLLLARWLGTAPDGAVHARRAAERRTASDSFIPHRSLPLVFEIKKTMNIGLRTNATQLEAGVSAAIWLSRAKLLSEGDRDRVGTKKGRNRAGACACWPPIARERVPQGPDGLVRIVLEHPFADGTVAIDLDPLSLLSRLAASVHAPGRRGSARSTRRRRSRCRRRIPRDPTT